MKWSAVFVLFSVLPGSAETVRVTCCYVGCSFLFKNCTNQSRHRGVFDENKTSHFLWTMVHSVFTTWWRLSLKNVEKDAEDVHDDLLCCNENWIVLDTFLWNYVYLSSTCLLLSIVSYCSFCHDTSWKWHHIYVSLRRLFLLLCRIMYNMSRSAHVACFCFHTYNCYFYALWLI